MLLKKIATRLNRNEIIEETIRQSRTPPDHPRPRIRKAIPAITAAKIALMMIADNKVINKRLIQFVESALNRNVCIPTALAPKINHNETSKGTKQDDAASHADEPFAMISVYTSTICEDIINPAIENPIVVTTHMGVK